MPKIAASDKLKVSSIVKQYPSEFSSSSGDKLYCKICECIVKHEKTFFVDSHRSTAKHSSKAHRPSSSTTPCPNSQQTFLELTTPEFAQKVTKAFLSADIPLNKLEHPAIKDLFKTMGHTAPTVYACRKQVSVLFEEEKKQIIDAVSGKKVFFIVDEADVGGTKYFNVLVGDLEKPDKTWLCDCVPLDCNLDSAKVCQLVDDIIREFSIHRSNFLLLISDAARYMTSAGSVLKTMYPNLFHITCTAHLLHNCAMKIQSFFKDIDSVIATMKALTVKNKDRRNQFSNMGLTIPHPVITRWGTWLTAAAWYSHNFPKVKETIDSMEGEGLLLTRAKTAINNPEVTNQLCQIMNYPCLVDMINRFESSKFALKDAIDELKNIEFNSDPCSIKPYIQKRVKGSDFEAILNMTKKATPPADYALLQRAQPTSVAVERSFSILKGMLRPNRPFKAENVRMYIVPAYNHSHD